AVVDDAVLLGMRNVVLEELLDVVQRAGIAETLLQAATSSLPVSPAGLARMLTADPGGDDPGDVQAVQRALRRLEDLSLVYRFPAGDVWVHRWTAEGLARLTDEAEHRARYVRAGRYRRWRVGAETQGLEDAIEAVRCFLAGCDFDDAIVAARACFDALRR